MANFNDPFDECFTGDELRELEFVATQAECNRKKQPHNQHSRRLPQSGQPVCANTSSKNINSNGAHSKVDSQNYAKIINEKCGEIRLLRDKVHDVERLLSSERQAKLAEEKKRKDEKLLQELDLKKKLEVYQDRLEFKNTELQETYQIIKNLETKVKDLSTKSEKAFPKVIFDDEKLPSKKLKLVKPENPCVFIKKETLDHSQVHDATMRDSSVKHFQCWNLSGSAQPDRALISDGHQHLFYRLLSFYVASTQPDIDLHETTHRLLQAQSSYPCMLEDATMLASFALCTLACRLPLTAEWHKAIMGFCFCPATTNSSLATIECLQVLLVLLQSIEGLSECFLDDNIILVLSQFIAQSSLQSFVLCTIGILLEKSKSAQAALFLPVISEMNSFCVDSLLHDFIYKCIPHSILVEQIVKSDENEESLFEKVCTLTKCNFITNPLFLQQSLQVFVTMMGNCNPILLRHGCYSLIFGVTTSVMHDLFDIQEHATLLRQCMYTLYFCLLSLPSCLVGRHKLARLKVQICLFLESQPKSHWAEELKRLLNHYN